MSVRTERVCSEIQEEIASMLLRGEVKDPRLGGLISVTRVEISRDLQQARIFISVLGRDEQAGEATVQALQHAAGFFQAQLGRRLRLRNTPHLSFVLDRALEEGHRMAALLAGLHIPPAEDDGDPPIAQEN